MAQPLSRLAIFHSTRKKQVETNTTSYSVPSHFLLLLDAKAEEEEIPK